jgi:hypothetical protein
MDLVFVAGDRAAFVRTATTITGQLPGLWTKAGAKTAREVAEP